MVLVEGLERIELFDEPAGMTLPHHALLINDNESRAAIAQNALPRQTREAVCLRTHGARNLPLSGSMPWQCGASNSPSSASSMRW